MDWTAGADLSTGFWGSGPAPAPACAFAFAFFMATITFHRFTFGRFGRVCCMLLVCVLYLAYGAYITAESRELCPRRAVQCCCSGFVATGGLLTVADVCRLNMRECCVKMFKIHASFSSANA